MRGSIFQVDETQSNISIRETEEPALVMCGWRIGRVKMCSLSGTRLERQVSRQTYPTALSGTINVTAIALRSLGQASRERVQASTASRMRAHARCGFYEALDHAPKEAGWILIQIGHLYEIERRLRRQQAGPALRDAYRTSQSMPLCRRIHRVLKRSISRALPAKELDGKAVSYVLGQWESWRFTSKNPKSRSTRIWLRMQSGRPLWKEELVIFRGC